MLGGLYILFNTIGLTIGYIKNGISNTNSKNHANKLYTEGKNPTHTYIDTQGYIRDIYTNHKVFTYRDKNKDLIVKDLKTGTEINLDKPIREDKYKKEKEKAIQKARENNGIAQFGRFTERQYQKSFLYFKDRYIDIYGNIYIKKFMIWNTETLELNESNRIGCFYMNIETNKIDYIEVINSGKVFRHCSECTSPYRPYDMLYANEKESEKYKEYYNQYICENKEEPLRYWGKFWEYDYKRRR